MLGLGNGHPVARNHNNRAGKPQQFRGILGGSLVNCAAGALVVRIYYKDSGLSLISLVRFPNRKKDIDG